jgi:molybdopterin-binding protein
MQLSARNVFKGKIVNVQTGPIMSKVQVDIGGGNVVTAVITSESVETMNATAGMDVSVMIKSTDVMLAK